MSVVALGDRYFITALRAAGVDGREVRSQREAEEAVEALVGGGKCAVVIVADGLAAGLERKREELARRRVYYPVFVVVPEMDGRSEAKTGKLYELISQAVGARLKLGEA